MRHLTDEAIDELLEDLDDIATMFDSLYWGLPMEESEAHKELRDTVSRWYSAQCTGANK